MPRRSIGDYALVSDCQTAALVSRDGSVDWYCPPRFDAPSIFARLLDEDGGHWSINPTGDFSVERCYLENTMVLRTEFRTARGRVALTDALAFEDGARGHEIGQRSPHTLLRRVEGLEGEVELRMELAPRLEYALTEPLVVPTAYGATARAGPANLYLFADCAVETGSTDVAARFTLQPGEVADFALVYRRAAVEEDEPDQPDVGTALENAREGWASWSEMHRNYDGLYEEQVHRSGLVLQALTYAPTGAVVAAPTTSLPEEPGGESNWDYRYARLRDFGLVTQALLTATCPDEPENFLNWVDRASGSCLGGDQPRIVYGVEGETDVSEYILGHLDGFAGSRPVRVGNDAWRQRQLDVFGEVVEAAYLLRDVLGERFGDVAARLVASLANRAAADWREPDSGMWEARDAERPYLSSKVMCWVALDRAVKLTPRLGDHAEPERWKEARDEVRSAILDKGWSAEAGAYAGVFGSDRLDASVLLMPLVGFLPANDPRMHRTIEKIAEQLASSGLVERWKGDGNGFLLCTFWLVECLARCGETKKATELFHRASTCANDLGLLSEQADPATGELWGNFPQGFSHVGLINAARCLSEATASQGAEG